MGNLLKVARAEYARLVKKRSFVLALAGMPLFIGLVIAVAIVSATSGGDGRPLGYVDLAGVTTAPPAPAYQPGTDVVQFVPYGDEDAARVALQAGEIQGYYLIPADYMNTRQLRLYTWGRTPSGSAQESFTTFLQAHLLPQAPAEAAQVLLQGTQFVYRELATGRESPVEGFIVSGLLPFVIGFFFLMVVMNSGGYLLQAVTTEKENRMVEVMVTSVSPLQLIGGKAVGLIGVALTQVVVWLAALVVALVIAVPRVPFLAGLQIPWPTLLTAALYFLPTYVLLAGMMITVGSMVTELQHGQQIAGLFNLLFALPFFFLILIFTNPDSPILVALTLFPTTSMMMIAMRQGVTSVPAWQFIVSFILVLASGAGSIWVAAQVFRMGMLAYGQPLSAKSMLNLLRPAARVRLAGQARGGQSA